jgi:hypothetical protein
MGKMTQLVVGALAPGDPTSNLMAANVTGGSAALCADMMNDFRTGQMLGASPRAQWVSQVCGAAAGALAGSAVYLALKVDTWCVAANLELGGGLPLRTAAALVLAGLAWTLMAAYWREEKQAEALVHFGWLSGLGGLGFGYYKLAERPEWHGAALLCLVVLTALHAFYRWLSSGRPWAGELLAAPMRSVLRAGVVFAWWGSHAKALRTLVEKLEKRFPAVAVRHVDHCNPAAMGDAFCNGDHFGAINQALAGLSIAPIDWLPLIPVVAVPHMISLPKNATNPHAAMLWIDFVLSKEGQTELAKQGRVPIHPLVAADPPRLNTGFRFITLDPMKFLDKFDFYNRLWEELLIKPR